MTKDHKWISDLRKDKLRFAYWEGHRDFAYDLLLFIKPKRIIELGSQYGCSLFAFCQSIKENNLDTEISAVDLWTGDIGGEESGEEIFEFVKKTAAEDFSTLKLNLHQMSFDEALDLYPDNWFDLIHIDGGHKFEEVDHDFTTWLPKLKDNGIILFHDVHSTIDQGSCDHWEYIKQKYRCHFEYEHSCGLGILFPKGYEKYTAIKESGFFEKYKDLYQYRSQYNYTKQRFDELAGLYEERYKAIQNQSELISERDKTIAFQNKLILEKEKTIESQARLVDERDATIKSQDELIADKEKAIASQAKLIDERDATIKNQDELIVEKERTIADQTELIDERDATIKSQDELIAEKERTIADQTELIDERDATIKSQDELIAEKEKAIVSQAKLIDERDATIKSQDELIAEKEKAIASQAKLIDERDATIKSQNELIAEKERTIADQTMLIDERDATIDFQNALIEEKTENLERILARLDQHSLIKAIIVGRK